jgi:DNA-directed RNA polymerase sigma subunit (sigma70/sigma32)
MNPLERLKNLHREMFVKGQEAVAKEVAAQNVETQVTAVQRAAQVVEETIDLADKLAADGNPKKRRLAELVSDTVLGAMEDATQGGTRAQEVRAAISEPPFSNDSPKSVTSSPDSMRALPPKEDGQIQPPKPRRGRPPGSKNRPRG